LMAYIFKIFSPNESAQSGASQFLFKQAAGLEWKIGTIDK